MDKELEKEFIEIIERHNLRVIASRIKHNAELNVIKEVADFEKRIENQRVQES